MSCKCMKSSGDIRKLSRHFRGLRRLSSIHCRSVSLGKGTSGLTTGATLATAALYLRDSSSHQVEHGRSFAGIVAVVRVLSAAHLQEQMGQIQEIASGHNIMN